MTCTQTQTLLDAYADAELGHIAAFRVRRHLAGCADCAAQLAGIQRLNASVQAWRDLFAPAALEGRIVSVLPQTASAPPPRDRRVALLPPTVPLPAVPRGLRVVRHAAFALLCATVTVASWLVLSSLEHPTLAYADVVKAMQQAQVISFTTLTGSADAKGSGFKPFAPGFTSWVRRSPPAIAVTDLTGQSLEDTRGTLGHSAQGRYWTGNLDTKDLLEQVREAFQIFTQRKVSQPFDDGNVYETATIPQQRMVELNGQQRVLFTFITDTVFRPSKYTPGTHNRARCSIWVDPKTRLAVRRETFYWQQQDDTRSPYTYRMVVDEDFHYNQTPPPGVFDWSPPPGAKVRRY
jgi:hypothetical protein